MSQLLIRQVDRVTKQSIVVILSDGRTLLLSLEAILRADYRVLEDSKEE